MNLSQFINESEFFSYEMKLRNENYFINEQSWINLTPAGENNYALAAWVKQNKPLLAFKTLEF